MMNFSSLSPKTIARIARGSVSLEQKFYYHSHGWSNRYCVRVTYPNGYGASIVLLDTDWYGEEECWEVALLKDGELDGDDEGWDGIMVDHATEEEVIEMCDRIFFM